MLKTDAEYDSLFRLRTRLTQGFDEICGDTFCGGDYSDLTSVRLACSATEKTRKVRECVWTFAGSYGAVDGRTGALTTAAETFTCRFAVGTKVEKFLALADALDPLRDPIPGQSTSVYESLYDCFRPSQTLPAPTRGRYVDFVEGLSEDDFAAFTSIRHALAGRFREACGDTFCEGEYSFIEPVDLRCSVQTKTGQVGACTWVFAAVNTSVSRANGRVNVDAQTFACDIPFAGKASDLVANLAAAAEPLYSALPGSAGSINDALGNCL